MYEHHRARIEPDSSDWCILSPEVPFFREDDGIPLDRPWSLDVITCAAPYAPRVGLEKSRRLLKTRIHRVLEIAWSKGYDSLVLGAWGCGAFGNDSRNTAKDFRDELSGPFLGAFAHVVFAIADWSPERRFLGPFRETFESDAKSVGPPSSQAFRHFLTAQEPVIQQVLEELSRGSKRGHWMWFVFPQLAGLGSSTASRIFAIRSIAEAASYLAHPVLGPRLIECCETILRHPDRSARQILGAPDDLKLRSCATLFMQVQPGHPVFGLILSTFFDSGPDQRTIELLEETRDS
jgi:uncharacterized protein (DUF1810 family)